MLQGVHVNFDDILVCLLLVFLYFVCVCVSTQCTCLRAGVQMSWQRGVVWVLGLECRCTCWCSKYPDLLSHLINNNMHKCLCICCEGGVSGGLAAIKESPSETDFHLLPWEFPESNSGH